MEKSVRDGVREEGGIVIEFKVNKIKEKGKRKNEGIERNMEYIGMVEVI